MSAFNAFFAQLTGGGGGDAPPSAAAAAAAAGVSADHRGNGGTADGGGGGGGRADGAFGVPLTGAAVTYDPESDRSRFGNPQCTTVTTLPEVSHRRGLCKQGALVVANADFFCYGISSSIRVLHRPTLARALVKPPPHLGNAVPQDICLLGTTATATTNMASGFLACATSEGDVLIWELVVRASAPGVGAAASADKAMEVSTQLVAEFKGGGAQSVAWHTSGMRTLAVVSGSSVVISDFVGQQDQSGHLPGAVCKGHYKQITNASFSRGNGDVLATASEDGTVRVWDTRSSLLEATPSPQSIACLRAFRAAPEGSTLSRVLVVDSDMAIVTGDEDNRLLKVWPAPASNGGAGAGAGALEGVLPSQVLSLPGRGALSLEVDPGGEFVFAAGTEEGLLYALHLAEGGQKGIRMDYLRPYSLAHPVQSFAVLSKQPEPEYGYDDSPPAAEDRILLLFCAQTKPVQLYRIAVRDALPPAGVFAKPADNGNDGAPAHDDRKVGGDPPVSSAPGKVDEEDEEEEEEAVVATGVRRGGAEEEGDVDVGVVVDSVAVSKEGGAVGGGEGGESAPSFEKKLDMDITDEPLGLSTTVAAAVAPSPPVSASSHPSPTSSDDDGSRSSRTSTSTSTSSADSSLVDEEQMLPPTMASKPLAPRSPGYAPSSVDTPSGVMLGDGAAGGGDANAGSSSTAATARTSAAGMDIRGEEAGGAAAATSGGADSSPTAAAAAAAAAAAVDGPKGKDSARVAAAGLGVTATALTAAMAEALSDTSSGGGVGGPSPVLDPAAAAAPTAAADVGGAFSSGGVSKGEGTSSSSSDASKRGGGIPSPMMLGESAAAGGGGGEAGGGALWAAAVEAEIASAEMASSTTMPAAAPRERVATEELRRFLAPGDVEGPGAAAGAAPSSPLAAVGEASGAAAAAGVSRV